MNAAEFGEQRQSRERTALHPILRAYWRGELTRVGFRKIASERDFGGVSRIDCRRYLSLLPLMTLMDDFRVTPPSAYSGFLLHQIECGCFIYNGRVSDGPEGMAVRRIATELRDCPEVLDLIRASIEESSS